MTVVYSPIKVRVENGEILDVENVLYLDADECTKRAMHLSKNGSGLWIPLDTQTIKAALKKQGVKK